MSYHRTRLYLMDLASGESQELLPDLDRSISNPRWAGDGERLFFTFDDRGDTVLAAVGLDGDMQRLASGLGGTSLGRPYSGAAYALGGDDRYAFTMGNTLRPADMGTGREGSEPRQLTFLNDNGIGQRDLAAVEERWVTSSADGEEFRPGWRCLRVLIRTNSTR
jgi:Tol biopolymer transport system component